MVRHLPLKGFYEIEKTIGCGGFAKVKLATHIATGEKVAIKIMNKVLLGADLPRVKLELHALKSLAHENICKLYEVIETDTHFFIVIEYCSGGELFDHIVEKNRLSESKSRMFFRQIVSAVAYLHSLGYAHRDLKPENVLLDKYQNLKLIDFGLCAKPEMGMESPLFTSCGSPTYAAPELVSGTSYLGTEVDVWAMGVLLYALLTGSLPFDDLNIDGLYKKILSGQYHKPSYMSKESLSLIHSMLQVDPKKRITVKELQHHSWLTLGILDPIQIIPEDFRYYDSACVQALARYHQVDSELMWRHLQKWDYDYCTSTYFLLLTRKRKGLPLKLNSSAAKLGFRNEVKNDRASNKAFTNEKISFLPQDGEAHKESEPLKNPGTPVQVSSKGNVDENTPVNQIIKSRKVKCFAEPSRPSSIRKPLKRLRSPGLEDGSPVPKKKPAPEDATSVITPDRKIPEKSDTPGSARRVFGSLERSFHKVVNVLTPRKNDESCAARPALLSNKELFNVSTTQCYDPELVITELREALERKGIHCKRKGFILRGKFEPDVTRRLGECSFELEICYLPRLVHDHHPSVLKKGPLNSVMVLRENGTPETNTRKNSLFVGIRRKRLKGDSWLYKRVCEEVLALTSAGFKAVAESSV